MTNFILGAIVAAAVLVPTIGKLSEDVEPMNDQRMDVIEAVYQQHLK